MTMFYSKTTNGFYSDDIHDDMPSDIVEVSFEDYEALLNAQSSGKMIVANSSGYPEAVDQQTPSQAAVAKSQIVALENSVTPRRSREAILSDAGKAWLQNVETQIAQLRTNFGAS